MLDALGGGGAQDRPDVERRLHAVEQQRDAGPRSAGATRGAAASARCRRAGGHRRRPDVEDPVARPRREALDGRSPARSSQRASESAPRCFCTTRQARRRPAASRPSQRSSRSCRAALPIRIGGFDQMPVEARRRRARRRARRPARWSQTPAASALAAAQRPAPARSRRPPTPCAAGRPAGEGHGDRAVAAAQVEQVPARSARARRRRAAGSFVPGSTRSAENTPRSVVERRADDVGQRRARPGRGAGAARRRRR